MHFCRFSSRNFRNLLSQEIEFFPRVNIFYGENGQGKTNLLEAIWLTVGRKSFRPTHTASFINNSIHISTDVEGDDQIPLAKCELEVEREDLSSQISCTFQATKIQRALNRKAVRTGYLTHRFPLVIFTPDSLLAAKSGPALRREMIDGFLVSTSIEREKTVSNYNRLLRARNRLLKEVREKPNEREHLESLTELFLARAAEYTWARLQCLSALESRVSQAMNQFFGFQGGDFEFAYQIGGLNFARESFEKVLNALGRSAGERLPAEISRGTSLVGPHMHDIQFHWRGANSRFFSSQGQQRSIILSFKMAQILYHFEVFGEYPVLLLDDVLSELDEQRRLQLLSFLASLPSQIFMTATDLDVRQNFAAPDVVARHIESGRIGETGL